MSSDGGNFYVGNRYMSKKKSAAKTMSVVNTSSKKQTAIILTLSPSLSLPIRTLDSMYISLSCVRLWCTNGDKRLLLYTLGGAWPY